MNFDLLLVLSLVNVISAVVLVNFDLLLVLSLVNFDLLFVVFGEL